MDKDKGVNFLVSYKIRLGDSKKFIIDFKIGVIIMFEKLDCEEFVFYNLVIIVRDYGIFLLLFIVLVFVKVFDENDNMFKFLLFFY